jgi:hypothetical protein
MFRIGTHPFGGRRAVGTPPESVENPVSSCGSVQRTAKKFRSIDVVDME